MVWDLTTRFIFESIQPVETVSLRHDIPLSTFTCSGLLFWAEYFQLRSVKCLVMASSSPLVVVKSERDGEKERQSESGVGRWEWARRQWCRVEDKLSEWVFIVVVIITIIVIHVLVIITYNPSINCIFALCIQRLEMWNELYKQIYYEFVWWQRYDVDM